MTNIIQSGVIAAAANITAQLAADGAVASGPLLEQVVLTMTFIAPIVTCWIPILGSLGLHWTLATAVDQFLFSPLFNIAIFWFISAAFKGGIMLSFTQHDQQECTKGFFSRRECVTTVVDRYEVSLTMHPGMFAAVSEYSPIWATQMQAYYLWLPSTIVRETFVPPHFKGIFINAISFFWNIIFSFILA
uniref:Uncharacterized protein n=1 Tax=Haptolina brevifila TaxID=156173 RepID=A0A7S2J6V3_9EUKA